VQQAARDASLEPLVSPRVLLPMVLTAYLLESMQAILWLVGMSLSATGSCHCLATMLAGSRLWSERLEKMLADSQVGPVAVAELQTLGCLAAFGHNSKNL
jgi:hypothetical protein